MKGGGGGGGEEGKKEEKREGKSVGAVARPFDGAEAVVSVCTRGQRARTKDEHERGGGKGKRESAEDAFRCATRGIKDGRDFGNAGLYAANNQCILVCCLGLHGRLHRDKCNAANLLTSLPTYRVSEKLMEPTSFDRDRSRSSPADKRITLFSLRFPLDFNFSRSYRDFCSIGPSLLYILQLPKNCLSSILFI